MCTRAAGAGALGDTGLEKFAREKGGGREGGGGGQ